MAASAVEVARHLLDFGVTTSDWVDEFVRLLMRWAEQGSASRSRNGSATPEKKDHLVVMAADEAVIHPERQKTASPEIVRDAETDPAIARAAASQR